MSRRKKLFVVGVAIAGILVVLILTSIFLNTGNIAAQSPSNVNPLNHDNNTTEPLLVVPENPIGTLGVISSLLGAIGLYIKVKRKR